MENHDTNGHTRAPLEELLARLRQFDTALVANTVEALRPSTGHEWYMAGGIQSVTPELAPTVGVAYTCELDSSTPGGEPAMDDYWRLLEMAEAQDLPVIWVVRTVGSRPEHECVLGDGMAKTMRSVGCVGLVTDGGARDLAGIAGAPFAVYCKGKTIHHGALRFRAAAEPVEIGGIKVRHGDVIHADHGGVIKIPADCLAALPEALVRMTAFEREAHAWLVRQDLKIAAKRARVEQLLARYGFDRTCVGALSREHGAAVAAPVPDGRGSDCY